MTRKHTVFPILMATAMLAGAGYIGYSVFAAQAMPGDELAQAPLNTQVQIPPAFIMAVDDSNSMTFERMFPGGDGRLEWKSSSFFSSSRTFHSIGKPCQGQDSRGRTFNHLDCYLYLFPHDEYNSSYSPGLAIPPLDIFGFARSHVFNASYFNPSVTYLPWRKADGTLWPNADPEKVRADPRDPDIYGDSFKPAYDTVYDLTKNRRVATERFQLLTGMSIPAGVEHLWNNNWSTSARSITSDTAVALSYFPATFYLPAETAAPTWYLNNDQARPIIAGACGPGCDLRRYQITVQNLQGGRPLYNEVIQNFANWFQYHRNRKLAMVGAMTHAMHDVANMRVGYFTINDRVPVTMRALPGDRVALYESFYGLQAGALVGKVGGTPNRDAVDHLGTQFTRADDGAPITYACQRNGGMLFTDGFTNSNNGPTTYGNVDGSAGLGAPFADNFSDTIADMAAKYYLDVAQGGLAPLRSGVGFPAGLVPVPDACKVANPDPRLNCQTNLHMNFYGVTLGARGQVYGVNAQATADPFAHPPSWSTNPRTSDGGPTIDEIWHATINSRGEFINARTPADIADAMRRILSAVSSGASPSGSIAISGARIGPGSFSVTPAYAVRNDGTDWSSTLTAERLSVGTGGTLAFTRAWEASARIANQTPSQRNVFFARSGFHTTDDNSVVAFDATNVDLNVLCRKPSGLYPTMPVCTSSNLSALGVSAAQAVGYLLGDTSQEVRRGGKLRDRSTVLGDIVNSTPVVSAPVDDYGYRTLPTAGGIDYGTSYAAYLKAKGEGAARQRYMVYVGANDGMLHAFDGGLDAPMAKANQAVDANGGREKFGYIPATAIGHMGNLLLPHNPRNQVNQAFQHRYYVDGPIGVTDAYYGGKWSTVLVGTAGAGGRAVFALDVADASRAAGSFSANDRLWEISDMNTSLTVAQRENIGHVLGRPVTVPAQGPDGSVKWRTIFGNGFNSASGKAVLYIVDIESGAPSIRMIEAQESGQTNNKANPNGLGNIVVVDRKRWSDATWVAGPDGFADTVYAGDQKGALWKFDLTVPGNSVTTPVFVTPEVGDSLRQPILGGITATAGPGGGVLLVFGTGSFWFYGDPADATQQSLYAVNDTSWGLPTTTWNRSSLRELRISTANGVRTVAYQSQPNVPAAGNWYINLTHRERFIGYPSMAGGTVFMPTYVPNPHATGCSAGGSNWLFGLDARTGLPALAGMRDAPGGNPLFTSTSAASIELVDAQGRSISAPIRDVAVFTLPQATPPPLPPPPAGGGGSTPPDPSEQQCWMVVSVAGAAPMYMRYPCGRQSWRQVQ